MLYAPGTKRSPVCPVQILEYQGTSQLYFTPGNLDLRPDSAEGQEPREFISMPRDLASDMVWTRILRLKGCVFLVHLRVSETVTQIAVFWKP